ncbi:unnamed protein product [Vitrella brassicaformis CCMP3155]|uniref:BCNT-C domain-containing protein n=2 Tax=Vitrella brassicaformis TaxID=1169539 RepID=A0A0G4EHH5_VITBC|nr:unnamed protein product [Vitrella brassicaformis CCMP3155]|eukprot:CEL95433.1 unnamed protein product [Vitrella brassicaformis CCMP3155]
MASWSDMLNAAALGGEDSDEDDEDYVDDGDDEDEEEDGKKGKKGKDGGAAAHIKEHRKAVKKERQAARINQEFQEMKLESIKKGIHPPTVDASDIMLQFQRRHPKPDRKQNIYKNELQHYIGLVNNAVKGEPDHLDVRSLKQESRSTSQGIDTEAVRRALGEVADAGKMTVTEQVRFAGESITLQRKVDKSSREAQKFQRGQDRKRKQELGGKFGAIEQMLKGLSGQKAVTSVHKSAVEWQNFKEQAGIEEELKQKTKDGYLQKQSFLLRADWRQHEIELAKRRKLEAAKPP